MVRQKSSRQVEVTRKGAADQSAILVSFIQWVMSKLSHEPEKVSHLRQFGSFLMNNNHYKKLRRNVIIQRRR